MKLCLSSPQLWRYQPAEVLTIAADLRYDGVELWAYQLLNDDADPAALARQAADLGLELSLHSLSWDLNFCSPLAAIRESSLNLLRQSIDLAAALNAGLAVMHPGRITVPGDAPDEYWPLLVEGLSALGHYAAHRGVRLAVEHMEPLPNELVVHPAQVKRLFDEVQHPNLTLAFDVAHVPWHLDLITYYQLMPPPGHLHLSDASPNRRHLPLGLGQHNLARFLAWLPAHYDGLVVIEGIEHQRTIALATANKAAWDTLISTTRVS